MDLYALAADRHTVIRADRRPAGDGFEWAVRHDRSAPMTSDGASPEGHGNTGSVVVDTGALPATIPDTPTVHARLLALAESEDVPGFRALAQRLGAWALEVPVPERHVIVFDQVHCTGDGFALGRTTLRLSTPAGPDESLAAAWYRFEDRLLAGSHRHPWPPWLVGDGLVKTWLLSCHVEASDAVLAKGRALADAIAEHDVALGADTPDVRSALAHAERARVELIEAKGHILGLERTIGFRDKQLRIREERITTLRAQVLGLEKVRATVLSVAGRRLALMREPRKFAGAVKRRAKREVKRRLR